jgi:hypothetical protein
MQDSAIGLDGPPLVKTADETCIESSAVKDLRAHDANRGAATRTAMSRD